jgi:hypothetical protein
VAGQAREARVQMQSISRFNPSNPDPQATVRSLQPRSASCALRWGGPSRDPQATVREGDDHADLQPAHARPRWLTCSSSNPCRDGGAAAGHPTPRRSSIHPLLRRAATWETVQSCTQLQVLFAMALSQVCQGNSAHLFPHACYNFFSQ